MKRKLTLVIMLSLLCSIALLGCSNDSSKSNSASSQQSTPATSDADKATVTPEPTATTEPTPTTEPELTDADLEAKLQEQPLYVKETKYVVQDEKYKSLYPDMLQAIILNNTKEVDIKNAIVAFVAWDENKLPVKITGQFDFTGGAYIKEVNYSDINLVSGKTYGEENGFALAEDNKIDTFKAIVVSYESFDGETWENPYYEDFCKMYEGIKLN